LEVLLDGETVWLSQKQMAALFDCSADNVGLHLKNIFKETELSENSVTEECSVTASDGKNYKVIIVLSLPIHLILNLSQSSKFQLNQVSLNPL